MLAFWNACLVELIKLCALDVDLLAAAAGQKKEMAIRNFLSVHHDKSRDVSIAAESRAISTTAASIVDQRNSRAHPLPVWPVKRGTLIKNNGFCVELSAF